MMAAFPLANLNSALLEMVITKLDYTSYFRLQQTCRGMNDFIGRNRNISIHLNGYYKLISRIRDEICCYDNSFKKADIELDTLHGTRLASLYVYGKNSFEYICNCLRKYRLTFDEVNIARTKWTQEQILMLLKLAKPLKIFLNSEGSNVYKALFQIKSLKTVIVNLNPEQVAIVVPKLLFAFSEVIVKVDHSEKMFGLIRTVLQILRSQPLPNLHKFVSYIEGNIGETNAYPDVLEDEFREFNLTVKWSAGNYIDAAVEMLHFPDGSSCKVVFFHDSYVHLYCGVGDVQNWAFWNK